MKYKFKIGDQLEIIRYGNGCHSDSIGQIVTVLSLGEYASAPGYKVTEVKKGFHNSMNGHYGYMVGEISFKLFKPSISQLNYEIY